MLNIIAAAGVALSLFTPVSGSSDPWGDTPPADSIVINVVTVNGTGCKPGTAAVAVADGGLAFTVTYSTYLAGAGPSFKVTDGRKNCQLNLKVAVPAGFTYAIASADYRGYASFTKPATAVQKANYYFQGMPETVQQTHNITPRQDDWQFGDSVPVEALVYKPCGEIRNLNINTELRVASTNKKVDNYAEMDSTDGSISTKYHFNWLKCPKK
jgi:hypothetical protein